MPELIYVILAIVKRFSSDTVVLCFANVLLWCGDRMEIWAVIAPALVKFNKSDYKVSRAMTRACKKYS